MKRKLMDPPTRWGYYLIGIAAGFGVTAGLLQSPIGMLILLPALPLLCIILALVFTLRQRTADVLLPLLLLLGMAAAFQLWCVAEHESSWLTLLRAFFWPCLFSYFVTVYLVLHWSDGWCKKKLLALLSSGRSSQLSHTLADLCGRSTYTAAVFGGSRAVWRAVAAAAANYSRALLASGDLVPHSARPRGPSDPAVGAFRI